MGSLFSAPKQPAILPPPLRRTEPPRAVPPQSSSNATEENSQPAQRSAEARVENILNRRRGRSGTIQTSFRGVLGSRTDDGRPKRKSLLGE